MNTTKLNDWLQIVASLAILVGLFVVVQELRQNNSLAKAERTSDIYTDWSNIYRFEIENDFLLLLQKSVEHPAELSDSEILRLAGHYTLITNAYMHQASLQFRFDLAYDLEKYIFDIVWYLNSPIGREWLAQNEEWVSAEPELFSALKSELAATPIPTQFELIHSLKNAAAAQN